MRWPDGPVCPACCHKEHYYLKTQRRWKCKECYKQFSVKLGTIFEDSPLGLDKWLCAMWLLGNCKNGISSCELARDLGITQKSAWFMLHRIRKAMQDGSLVKVGGSGSEVEVDETFIGGKARNMHLDKRERRITGTGGKDKTAVMGILERGGKIRVAVVPSRRKGVLQEKVKEHVASGTALYTDALKSYDGLTQEYAHKVIDHAEAYVDGRVHTNGLENFWSLLKRGISGTYVSVEPFHLFRYLDEQTFRFNNRKEPMDDSARFYSLLSQVAGHRLTYAELTGKENPRPV
jgi:transposase-like protein